MKNKLALLVLTLSLFASYAHGQTRLRIGGKIGYSQAKYAITNTAQRSITDNRPANTFSFLLYGDYRVAPSFFLQLGAGVQGKGSDMVYGDRKTFYTNYSANPIYLEVPLSIVYKLRLGQPRSYFMLGAGPYVGFGIAGKERVRGLQTLPISGFDENRNIEFSKDASSASLPEKYIGGNINPFDAGLNGMVGFEISRLTLLVQYGYGLVDVRKANDNTETFQNRVLSFTVGLIY